MRRAVTAAALAAAVVAGPAPATAQPPSGAALRPGHVLLGVGAAWLGAEDLGAVRAETRQTALGTTDPPPFALFDTRSQLDAAAAIEGTVTIAVTPGWAVEVRGSARNPTLTTTITSDVEASGTFTAEEDISEYVVDGSVLYHPGWGALGSRTRLYLLAGGGYLRQLHEDNVLAETGATGHAGGGARVWLAGGHGSGIEAGLTGDVRWTFRSDGIAFEDGVRSLPAVSLRAFVGF
jgi:hypothetical protein